MKKTAPFLLAAALLAMAVPALAGWQATIESHPSLPTKFLAVDKDAQKFFILGQKSPLRVLTDLPCVTGQRSGDKKSRGDMRTPEGVYFIERRLTQGLNYELYGDQAFTLNFPNPVDKLRQKTGSGIWIHGRGNEIKPSETRGCVVLKTADLRRIQSELTPGTPVAIADSLRVHDKPGEMVRDYDAILKKVEAFSRDWQRESPDFFKHFDPEKYSLSSERFDSFRQHKLNVWKAQPWIQVAALDVRVLPGPDYWVSYFKQYYRTPTMLSEGLKRIYWQKDKKGEYRIVGMEWKDANLDLESEYLRKIRSDVEAVLDSWREAWRAGDLDAYLEFYLPGATQGGRAGVEAIRSQKAELWGKDKPKDVTFGPFEVTVHPQGLAVAFTQEYASASGYSDRGWKTMVLTPDGLSYRIASEDWSALQ
ncbi:MAG: L,D-transpeptidase family protein [Thermodesulfobacteriota bacterium]